MVDSIIQDLFGPILPWTLAATTAIRAFMLTPRRAKVLVSCICMSFSHQNGWFTIKKRECHLAKQDNQGSNRINLKLEVETSKMAG